MSDLRVYFEKQGADRLCGVHCLNALAQGPFFTQVDLNKFAAELDKEESALLTADPSQQQKAAPRSMTISSLGNRPSSHNVDETGNFSLGVLEKALGSRFGTVVENAARRDIIQQINREGLESHDGFVVNLREHWFSARAFPNPSYPGVREWFFLDSLKPGPIAVTENELWGTLQGIIQSGGNVFVLTKGPLPAPGGKQKVVLKSHQYFLTREEIKKLLEKNLNGNEESSSMGGGRDVSKKDVMRTDWSKMGSGNTLNQSSSVASAAKGTSDGVKIMVDCSSLKPEPQMSSGEVITMQVRVPSGDRKIRKFSLENDTVKDLCDWLECAFGRANYSLVGRGWRLDKSTNGRLTITGTVGMKEGEENTTSEKSLGTVGLKQGSESFNLSV